MRRPINPPHDLIEDRRLTTGDSDLEALLDLNCDVAGTKIAASVDASHLDKQEMRVLQRLVNENKDIMCKAMALLRPEKVFDAPGIEETVVANIATDFLRALQECSNRRDGDKKLYRAATRKVQATLSEMVAVMYVPSAKFGPN